MVYILASKKLTDLETKTFCLCEYSLSALLSSSHFPPNSLFISSEQTEQRRHC